MEKEIESLDLIDMKDRLITRQYDILKLALDSYEKIKAKYVELQKAYKKNDLDKVLCCAEYIGSFSQCFMSDFAEQLSYLESILAGYEVFCSKEDIMDWTLDKTQEITFCYGSEVYKKFFNRKAIENIQ